MSAHTNSKSHFNRDPTITRNDFHTALPFTCSKKPGKTENKIFKKRSHYNSFTDHSPIFFPSSQIDSTNNAKKKNQWRPESINLSICNTLQIKTIQDSTQAQSNSNNLSLAAGKPEENKRKQIFQKKLRFPIISSRFSQQTQL